MISKDQNPQAGKGAYVDPATGKQRVLCHTNCSKPHGHVNNPQGQRGWILMAMLFRQNRQQHTYQKICHEDAAMMHDWTLASLMVEWVKGMVTITFKNSDSQEVLLIAEGLADLKIPKREDWGESVSVNEVEGSSSLDNGNSYIAIEIQSGDKIELEARSIYLPDDGSNPIKIRNTT